MSDTTELTLLRAELKEVNTQLAELHQLVAALRVKAQDIHDNEPCTSCDLRACLLEDYQAKNGLEALLDSIHKMQRQNTEKLKRLCLKYE